MEFNRRPGWRPELLRARRQATGMVLEQVADAVRNLSSPSFDPPRATFQVVGRHERGETYPGPRYRQAYCMLFETTESQLGFVPETANGAPVRSTAGQNRQNPALGGTRREITEPAPDVRFLTSRRAWNGDETAHMIHLLTREDFSLDRRDVVRGIPGLVFGEMLLESLEFWMRSPSPAVSRTRRRTSSVGRQELGEIEQAAQLFRTWDDRFGGGLRRKAVIGQLNEVAELLHNSCHPPDLSRRLFGVMAQLAETAATMSWDSGRGVLAQRYYLLALRSAKDAADRPFGANVLAGMARQLLYAGQAADALELVRLAHDGMRDEPRSTTHAMLYTREAWCYAKLGRVGAFRRATGKAEDTIVNRQDPAEDPYWIGYFDAAELAGVTGGRMLELARSDPSTAARAAAYIERAVQLRHPCRLRSSTLDRIGLAEVRLIENECEEASRIGHEAADIAERTRSDRVRVKLGRLYRSSEYAAPTPSILALRDRLRPLVSTGVAPSGPPTTEEE